MSELIDVLNMIVQDNTKANKQTDIVYGTVSSIAPLTVKLDDTMLPVPDVALVLTENVKSRLLVIFWESVLSFSNALLMSLTIFSFIPSNIRRLHSPSAKPVWNNTAVFTS